ncbi:MAG: HU family DNA-binding protein [Desulfovibrio sp.]|jgi:integration host factor subunit alpha|nr:HU family DNA-binding protein [Desulfovibrio sp.]
MSEKTLTKADIVDLIYEKKGQKRNEVKKLVESLLRLSKQAIKKDHFLLVSGLGKFEAYDKKARKGRNPQTDATITLPPRKVVVFRLSRKLRAELNKE